MNMRGSFVNLSRSVYEFRVMMISTFREKVDDKWYDGTSQHEGELSESIFWFLFVWCLTTHQPLWVISVRRY